MSTYWGLWCIDHQVGSGTGYKIRDWLCDYVPLRAALKELYTKLQRGRPIDFALEASWFEGDYPLIQWLVDHVNCNLEYYNEYGHHEKGS